MNERGVLCILVLAVALFSFAIPYTVEAATFNCTIRATNCNANETPLVYLNSSEAGNAPNNSHAMLANYTGTLYPYVVCCWTDAFRTLSNTCGGNGIAVLRLNQTNDSHVEAGNMTTAIYPFKACLNVTSGNITCEYPTSACSAGYSPVLSIASSDTGNGNLTNAHVGDYALYNRKTCCAIGGQNPPVIAYVNISPNGTATTRQDLECQNGTTTDADGDAVTLHYNWILNGTSATVLNLPMDYDGSVTHDISGYANHGTAVNVSFLPTGGYIGGAFYFDRNLPTPNVWIRPAGTHAIANKTITVMVKRASTGHWSGILGVCAGDFYLAINSGNNLVQSWTNSTGGQKTCSIASISDTNWHRVAVSTNVNGSAVNVTLYIDGSQASCVNNEGMSSAAATRYIGSFNSDCGVGGTVFNGTIDEVVMWDRTLTTGEILALYGNGNRFLNATELRRGNGWNCSITPIDSTGLNGSTKYSNRTIINGSAPLNVSLYYPLNNNQSVFERYVNFSWSTADERDGDTVTYNLSANVTPGLCGAQVSVNPTTTNYTYGELCVDQLYNWTVRACDIDGCSAWAPQYNFTIASIVSIILRANNTDFGSLNLGQSKDTVTGGVTPFKLENNGNVLVNITIRGNNSPFASVNLNSTAFQYKARANETGAFPAGTAQMTYTPVNSTTTNLVKQLNYTDVSDDVLVDINITVPLDEGAGAKSANITFTAGRWNST